MHIYICICRKRRWQWALFAAYDNNSVSVRVWRPYLQSWTTHYCTVCVPTSPPISLAPFPQHYSPLKEKPTSPICLVACCRTPCSDSPDSATQRLSVLVAGTPCFLTLNWSNLCETNDVTLKCAISITTSEWLVPIGQSSLHSLVESQQFPYS